MPHQTRARIGAAFLSLSLAALPVSKAIGLERAEPQGKISQPQSTQKTGDNPKQIAASSAEEVEEGSCAMVEASPEDEKSITSEIDTEPEEDDPAVDFYENLFKVKSVTGGGLGPAGFLKGAKTESRDHSVLIAASEKRQTTATQPQPISTQAGGPISIPAEWLGKSRATGGICRCIPLSKRVFGAVFVVETREKAEKAGSKNGESTESSPPPDKP